MELVEFTGDVEVIQKLGTFPNAEDGLTAEDLKKKFDEAPTAIKKYLNETLVPEVNRIGKNAGKPISVTITTVDGALTADKGYAELFAAHTAGQTLYCKLPDGSVLALAGADESGLLFQGENGRDYQQIIIRADGTITYKIGKYALLGELVTDATIGVYPSATGDGYESTDDLADLQESYKSGRTLVCNLQIDDRGHLRLPMSKKEDSAFYFSTVFEGKEYLVTITADGVTVEISECGGGNSGGNVDIPENVALLEDVTVDEASGDFIPMLSANGTEYRLSIGDDGIPFIKNLSGATVWSGTSGGNSGGGDSGDTGGGDTGEGGDDGDGSDDVGGVNWVSGAEIEYTVIADEYVNDETGEFVSDFGGYSRTDYIYCYDAGFAYYNGKGTHYAAFYDINKQYISGFSIGEIHGNYVNIPENAAYFAISASSLDGTVIKLYKKVEPTWTDGEPYAFAFVENEYINAGTGEPVTYSGWKRTDYVNCAGATRITKTNASANSQYGCLYNAEKEKLITMHTPDTTNGAADITIPVGACYFRTSDSNANMDALVLVPHA